MNDQLWKYLERMDRASDRYMTFIYCVNILLNIAITVPNMIDHFKPQLILELDDVHIAVSMMYITMNIMLFHQIRRRKGCDEINRSYLLVCYSILTALDVILEQIIVGILISGPATMSHIFSRANILYVAINITVIAIYMNRYFSLKRKYMMVFARKSWTLKRM